MKKLLVMLLALTMVLSMALTFAACGGDEDADSSVADSSSKADASADDASKDESSDAESSDAESSDAESSDAEDSATSADSSDDASADSSADGSSEDTSADVSVEDSTSEEVIEYITTPTKTNYALNKTYTITKNGLEATPDQMFVGYPSEEYADVNMTKLTDGVSATADDFTELGGAANITVSFVGTSAMYEYIIDLGDYYGDIKSITFRGVRDGYDYGNNRGFNETLMMAYVGDSIGSWSSRLTTTFEATQIEGAPEIGTQNDPDVKNVENFDYTFTFSEAQQGRFVKIIATSEVYVLQFDEIEIWN